MKKFIWVMLFCFMLTGCVTTEVFRRVSLGMTKEEISEKIGEPTVVRGGVKNKNGQVIEVWEYLLRTIPFPLAGRGRYLFRFTDGKLTQWGRSGDWSEREPDYIEKRIYDIYEDQTDRKSGQQLILPGN